MLVDDNVFCGSLNLANSYTSVRYGDGSFRDMNIILKKHPTKRVRDFFRQMLLKNEYFYPKKINPIEINKVFDEIDKKYAWQEAEEVDIEKVWPDAPKRDVNATEPLIKKKGQEELVYFLEETPPHKT